MAILEIAGRRVGVRVLPRFSVGRAVPDSKAVIC